MPAVLEVVGREGLVRGELWDEDEAPSTREGDGSTITSSDAL